MWVKFSLITIAVLIIGGILWSFVPWLDIQYWAAGEQRSTQNEMAGALRRIQAGDPLAIWTLCSATAAYGFFHALGPGHGKVLIGGAALASGATLKRLSVLTVLSSLAQAATAIVLVGGLVFILKMQSGDLADFTEAWLAPLSYGAIAMIGGVLVLRGVRMWRNMSQRKAYDAQHTHDHPHNHHHDHHDNHSHNHKHQGCYGHSHGPSAAEVSTLNSTRDAIALIMSIAVRPCTGALFVLVIAARFDAFAAGCLAVITMGFGTAAFNLTVATSGVLARSLARLSAKGGEGLHAMSALLHAIGGITIMAMSLSMLAYSLT